MELTCTKFRSTVINGASYRRINISWRDGQMKMREIQTNQRNKGLELFENVFICML